MPRAALVGPKRHRRVPIIPPPERRFGAICPLPIFIDFSTC